MREAAQHYGWDNIKYNYSLKEITKAEALAMVKKYHYSNILPRINKHFVGFFLDEELVGVVTLGWGTRPLHTIKKIFMFQILI